MGAGASFSSHAAQSFAAPTYGLVTFDQVGLTHEIELSANRQYAIVLIGGLYLIQYGVYASIGSPGLCTISFTPGGFDQGGKIPLTAYTMVSGAIVRSLGAQTRVGLHIDTTDNNTPVSLPATDQYANAYLTITRVGPYFLPI